MRYFQYVIIAALAGVASCQEKDKSGKPLDTTTSGEIKIAVDESLKPLLDAEVDTFEGIYTNASIDVIYTSESNAVDLLLKDSVRLIVITRNLTTEEAEALKAQLIPPRQIKVATEGIALIINKNRADSLLTTDNIRDMLSGKISTWKQLNKANSGDSLKVIFDNPSSGILRHLKDTLGVENLAKHCFAVNDNPAVIDYVSKDKNAIGLIGVSWISDQDDSTANQFLSSIRVAGLLQGTEYNKPYQAYIAQKEYPFSREVIIISREARSGLGSGFLTFVTHDKGQRIVLKAELVPATMPVRIIEVNQEP
ncbi:MAG TPA: substrate-binding domain-containing protein [Ohtaekwangia sp.]